ncbi:MAG: DUF2589 domain-containing protein [Chitinophagaceae bacterium]|nr:DUF2589 domain-containing protein [Chitinophagaceae bacterium]
MATSKSAAPRRARPVTKAATPRVSPAEATDVAVKAVRSVAPLGGGVGPLRGPSTNLVSELNNINFSKMIGGPLQAAIEAQTASAMATVNFINQVGFTVDESGKKELVMVDFSHKRKDVNADGTPNDSETSIRVPLLAMLPIPSIRIETVDINFNVKLNSVETASTSDKLNVAAEVKGGFGPVSFKVSAAYQRQSSTGVKVEKEYSLNVKVRATQDEMPAGLEKILNMLQS